MCRKSSYGLVDEIEPVIFESHSQEDSEWAIDFAALRDCLQRRISVGPWSWLGFIKRLDTLATMTLTALVTATYVLLCTRIGWGRGHGYWGPRWLCAALLRRGLGVGGRGWRRWCGAVLFTPNVLSLVFRRANLLPHKIRRTVRPALEGCAILNRQRIVKDIGTDTA
jgi:hypothetical protein